MSYISSIHSNTQPEKEEEEDNDKPVAQRTRSRNIQS